jgi:hypothetical protein
MVKADIKIRQQSIPNAEVSNSHGHHTCKVDIIFTEQELKAVTVSLALNPVRNMNDELVNYDAEIIIGSAIIGIDEMGQLDAIITAVQDMDAKSIKFGPIIMYLTSENRSAFYEQLSDLRDLWAENIRRWWNGKEPIALR